MYIIYIYIYAYTYMYIYIFPYSNNYQPANFCFVRSNFAIPGQHSFLKCFLCSALMCWSNVFRLFATTTHRTAITMHVLLKQVVSPLHLLSFVVIFSTHCIIICFLTYAYALVKQYSDLLAPLSYTLYSRCWATSGPDCCWTSASRLHTFSPFLCSFLNTISFN